MDYERSAKRRRTDISNNPPHDAVTAIPKPTINSANGQNITLNTGRKEGLDQAADGAASAEAIWLIAKEQSAAYRARARAKAASNRQQTTDVVHSSPAGRQQLGNQAKTVQQSTGKLKPVKKQLDPLRNHRKASSSPQKAAVPSRGGSSLGIFKQFRSPKIAAQGSGSSLKLRDRLEQAKADGEPTNGLSNTTRDDLDADDQDADDQEDELANDIPPPVVAGRRSHAAQTKATDTPKAVRQPKAATPKTFEDEIREIEAKAQETARTEEDEDEGVVVVRRTGRRPCPKRMMDDPDPGRLGADDSIAVAKVLDRRKTQTPNRSRPTSPQPSRVSEIKRRQNAIDVADHKAMSPKRAEVSTESLNPVLSALVPHKRSVSLEPAQLESVRDILLERVAGHRPSKLANLNDELAKVSNVLLQTIIAGESNSLLLIGACGSGKSALLENILQEQSVKHADDFHVVRLNGFLQTDDKIALREIWRQLGRDMGVLDEHENASRNVADTLATLLALLSHPAEMGQEPAQDHISKSVIFILDEFDQFAHHPRQTLLYNLFDVAQSRKAPIAVIGLTTRFNVTEQLEKRVKSRFSHRYVHLSLPKSFTAFQDIIRTSLTISEDDLSNLGRWNSKDRSQVKDKWSNIIELLLTDPSLETHIRRIYYTTKLVSDFLTSLVVPLATLPTSAALTSEAILEHVRSSLAANYILPPDSKLALLQSLSTLQMALLICAARLVAIYSMDTINFLLVYEEYKALASKAKLQATASGMAGPGAGARLWSKDVAKGAWGELVEIGLILEDGRGGAGSGRCEVGLEEIGRSNADLGSWGRWCREI
ncbi:hypothetical protein K431DRAFT_280676 [Polychaeton citri CBS 116435]|uniref:Origin recognition complex subunit 4 n=1 Tax=Polychaeton citri CBS 116435 TaxID=1314669 RepID=A0A9P4QJ99_9PEZI|nr:hypothetical protein K431DRAFT_280676 [Polychaeton citri CBS 116435]